MDVLSRAGTPMVGLKGFHWLDHMVFWGSIIGFTAAGISTAYYEQHREAKAADATVPVEQNQLEQALLGSRRMSPIPVALCLIGSYMTGHFILFSASEIYNYGTQYMLTIIGIALSSVVVSYVYVPVFHELQVSSSFEYLELRFARILRSIVALLFVMYEFFFLSLLVHIPAFDLSQMTGLRIDLVSFVMNAFVVIYVLIGGMRTVIHTAAFQVVLMILAVFLIVLVGTIQIGGPQTAFKAAHEGGRLIFFNFNPSLTERYTVWTVFIGSFMYWTSFDAVNQTMVQLYMSVGTLKKARLAILGFTIGCAFIFFICCYSGLLVYEKFYNCDPLTAKDIHHSGQLLPHYVMQAQGKLHGLPGLFAAAVFAAALSSSSVVINCTALVVLEDILKGLFKMNLREKKQMLVYKLTVIVLGVISFFLLFVFEMLTTAFVVLERFVAIIANVSFGIFTLGMLVPWANTYGTIIGAIFGTLFASIAGIGRAVVVGQGLIARHALPIDVSGCTGNVTTTPDIDDSAVCPLFRLAYYVLICEGMLVTIIVGTIASFIFGKTDLKTLDARLISPVLHRFLPEESFNVKSDS